MGSSIRVAPFEGSAAEWDAFVRAQRGWTHFHLHGWRDVMHDVLGHDAPYLAARDEHGTLVGVLPLVRVKSPMFGHFLVSVPFLNYGGPLGSDEGVRALASAAVQRADREHVGVLERRIRSPIPVDMPVSHRKITVLMDMTGGPDAVWKRLDSKVRSQVRRPQKEGITVRTGADQVPAFFEVFARHMRDLGTPTQSRALFEGIARAFPEDSIFAVAYHEDRPVACGCGFRWENEFEITWASALREYNRMSPNMLVYWELMRQTADAGVTTFNFGRCTPGGGTHKFKRQWGTTDEQLWWYEHRAPGATTPAEGEGAASLGPRVWRKLPLALATALGPRIVRFIP